MKEKIFDAMQILKDEYNVCGYTNKEYHDLLTALNQTIWNMEKFSLLDDVSAYEMQEIIHKEQMAIRQ